MSSSAEVARALCYHREGVSRENVNCCSVAGLRKRDWNLGAHCSPTLRAILLSQAETLCDRVMFPPGSWS